MFSIGSAKIWLAVATIAVAGVIIGAQGFAPVLFADDSQNSSETSTVIDDVPTNEEIPADVTPVDDTPADANPGDVTPPEDVWNVEAWGAEITEVPAAPVISGVYLIDSRDLSSTTGPAIDIAAGETVTLIIKGVCSITSTADDAIKVPATSSLTIKGFDKDSTLTVSSDDGSAIGCHSGDTGSITIGRIADLSATASGTHAYGIGGDGATVIIDKAHISSAIGGELFTYDDSYLGKAGSNNGKSDPEGGAGIGGSDISITDSVIDLVVGGSKAAGIGARFWQATSISIVDSIIGGAYGGSASAGIGGSREASGDAAVQQTITIRIENSNIHAYGGDLGAGIGSGYDTKCQSAQGVCDIVITSQSVISATGGKYAAGIGTGFHQGNLTGYIDSTVDVSDVHSGVKEYKNTYSLAQDIGYGVMDSSREGTQVTGSGITFTVAGTPIANPLE